MQACKERPVTESVSATLPRLWGCAGVGNRALSLGVLKGVLGR